jgi:hypothetical protein
MKVTSYKILYSDRAEHLETLVNAHINSEKNWQPLGPTSITTYVGHAQIPRFAQTMVTYS